jgi:hypothetical protein
LESELALLAFPFSLLLTLKRKLPLEGAEEGGGWGVVVVVVVVAVLSLV